MCHTHTPTLIKTTHTFLHFTIVPAFETIFFTKDRLQLTLLVQHSWLHGDWMVQDSYQQLHNRVTSVISLLPRSLFPTLCWHYGTLPPRLCTLHSLWVTRRRVSPRYLNMRGQLKIYGVLWTYGRLWMGRRKIFPKLFLKGNNMSCLFQHITYMLITLFYVKSWNQHHNIHSMSSYPNHFFSSSQYEDLPVEGLLALNKCFFCKTPIWGGEFI